MLSNGDRETLPIIKDGINGNNGGTPESRYQWNQSATSAPTYSANSQNPGNNWKTAVPTKPGNGYYLWTISAIKTDGAYGTWGNAIRLTGDTGSAGQDSAEREWIYRLSTTTSVTIPTTSDNTDGYIPSGWSNHPSGVDNNNIYEYACYRDKPKGTGTRTWSSWKGSTGGATGDVPILWSHWGRNGMDGDGTEYVFIRTTTETPPTISAGTDSGEGHAPYDGKTYLDDEFLPLSSVGRCTDDPPSVTSTYKYEWVAKRSKGEPDEATGERTWGKFQSTMSLWSKWSDDGKSVEAQYASSSNPTSS